VELELEGEGGLAVRKGAAEETLVGIDAAGRAYVDRTRSGAVAFHKKFSGRHEAPFATGGRLRVLVDRSSVRSLSVSRIVQNKSE
jgi:sucrose-6-phosphate hydrolase SacC (GH32 family)